MSEVKVRILKDHLAAANGVDLKEYKEGEVLKTGTVRLTPDLLQWYQKNPSYAEIYVEEIEEKAIEVAPENKAITSAVIENKSAAVEPEKVEVALEEAKEKPKEKFFTNPLKRNK